MLTPYAISYLFKGENVVRFVIFFAYLVLTGKHLSNLYICLATGLLATFIDAEFISGIMGTNQQRC